MAPRRRWSYDCHMSTDAYSDAPDTADGGGEPVARTYPEETSVRGEPARLDELSTRVCELELEIARLRPASSGTARSEPADSRLLPLSPPYIARAVVAVEGHLADMDRFAATGREIEAQQSKVAAAMRCCSALRRLCDDDEFLQILMRMEDLTSRREHGQDLVDDNILAEIEDIISDRRPVSNMYRNGTEDNTFHALEVQILQIAGLPQIIAETHVSEAINAYHRDPIRAIQRLRNPMSFLSSLRTLREASCLSADFLAQSVRQEQTRQRSRQLLTFGLGGTLIVVANSIATALLGPAGAAASGAVGSAAVGVAVQFLT